MIIINILINILLYQFFILYKCDHVLFTDVNCKQNGLFRNCNSSVFYEEYLQGISGGRRTIY